MQPEPCSSTRPGAGREQVLHPGEQAVTSPNLEPVSVKDDIAWSRNRDRMVKQLESLRAGLAQLHLPELRYSSRLLDRLPASTVFFAGIPNSLQIGGAELLHTHVGAQHVAPTDRRADMVSRGSDRRRVANVDARRGRRHAQLRNRVRSRRRGFFVDVEHGARGAESVEQPPLHAGRNARHQREAQPRDQIVAR